MDRQHGRPSNLWEYTDFELEIREGGPREYPLTVRTARGSEAEEQLLFPFDERELRDKLQALEIAILRSGTRRRRVRSQEEQTVQDFGRALFEGLFVGRVRTCYEVSRDEARRQNKGLRLKMRIQPPELARLPWEFLYDPDRSEYLALSYKTPLIRYLGMPYSIEPLPMTRPLKILGMVASPFGLDPLDVEHERELVEDALKDLQARNRVEMTWLEGQMWRDLQRAMRLGPWHVFHFIGHGGHDPSRDEGFIALANEAGFARYLRAEDLAQLLKGHYPLRLVLLNSCEGAQGSERDAFSSTAATLVRPGIPAVVAMQYEITDEAAIEFSRAFYEAVADGLPLDASVAEGRTALKIEMGNTFEWGTPVLYMHSPDGRVFDISTEVSPVGPVQGTGAQDREGRERLSRVDELYERARRASRAEEWQAVVDIFDEIHATSPAYPDPEGLLVLARESLTAQDHARKVAATYEEGLRHVEAKEWAQALECFGELQRLKPGYKDTEVQSELARDALAAERKHKLEKRAEEPGPRVRGEATEAVEETERGYDNPSAEDAGHGQSMRDRYHDAVRKIWERVRKTGDLYGSEVDQLKALADKLGLSKPQAEDIERRVLGDSKEVLVQDSKRGLGNTVLRKPNSLPDELRTPSNKPQGLPDDRLRDLPN